MLGRKTDLTRRERSAVRVGHHRFGVVVGEWVIQPGLDDPRGNLRWRPRRRDTDALLPEAQGAEDALDHLINLTSVRPYYNKELADHFGLTTATLSYHINLLLDIGILNFEPRPNNRFYYTTNKETLRTIFNMSLEMLLE